MANADSINPVPCPELMFQGSPLQLVLHAGAISEPVAVVVGGRNNTQSSGLCAQTDPASGEVGRAISVKLKALRSKGIDFIQSYFSPRLRKRCPLP